MFLQQRTEALFQSQPFGFTLKLPSEAGSVVRKLQLINTKAWVWKDAFFFFFFLQYTMLSTGIRPSKHQMQGDLWKNILSDQDPAVIPLVDVNTEKMQMLR